MDSRRVMDAQFDRAVEIVQSLPKTGPIQTGYEEKLTMYSLYKQATVGNVTTSRPQMWDMLGRAKWDEWAKHKDMDQYEAKWLYVDALLKVLKKYSDRTVARDLVLELESFGFDPSNVAKSRTPMKSSGSASSGSTTSDDHVARPAYPLMTPPNDLPASSHQQIASPAAEPTSEEETDDESRGYQVIEEPGGARRPQSSRSSHRYRTPMAGSLAMSPPAAYELTGVPPTQPHPGFETPSAFAETSSTSMPSSLFPGSSYVEQYSASSRPELGPGQHMYDRRYRHSLPPSSEQYGPTLLASRSPIEHAIERIQGHLAALTERLDSLETNTRHYQRSSASLPTGGSTPNWAGVGRHSPADGPNRYVWDFDDLGMWSLLIKPLVRGIHSLRAITQFFARNENRSPAFVVQSGGRVEFGDEKFGQLFESYGVPYWADRKRGSWSTEACDEGHRVWTSLA